MNFTLGNFRASSCHLPSREDCVCPVLLFSGVEGTDCVSVYSLLIRQCKYVEKDGEHIPCGRHEPAYHE